MEGVHGMVRVHLIMHTSQREITFQEYIGIGSAVKVIVSILFWKTLALLQKRGMEFTQATAFQCNLHLSFPLTLNLRSSFTLKDVFWTS